MGNRPVENLKIALHCAKVNDNKNDNTGFGLIISFVFTAAIH